MKMLLILWALLSVVVATGCAQTGRTTTQPNAQAPAGSPTTTDTMLRQQAECEGRGGGFWVAAAGACARGGGGM
jgi:hypothetical protein